MAYMIRRPGEVLAEFGTFGEALAWVNALVSVPTGVGVFWGTEGSSMSLREWQEWANHTLVRLESQGLSTWKLLASEGGPEQS